MKKLKNVLSLFDGMSCGQLALKRANIGYENYYASEIKPNAIKVTKDNFPNTIHVGDVTKLKASDLPQIDLLIGGSPCQDFSAMNRERKGLDGSRSSLFYEYLRLLKELKPKYFLLENVRMKKDSEKQLNEYLGVDGLHINSNLVSYQNRYRIYWTNIPNVVAPIDRNINFQDFKERDYDVAKRYKLNQTPSRIRMWNNGGHNKDSSLKSCTNITHASKIGCITRKQDRSPNSGLIQFDDFCRYLTREELEKGQTVPIGYTSSVSYNQAQDLLGDGWTVEVIAHIFNYMNEECDRQNLLS